MSLEEDRLARAQKIVAQTQFSNESHFDKRRAEEREGRAGAWTIKQVYENINITRIALAEMIDTADKIGVIEAKAVLANKYYQHGLTHGMKLAHLAAEDDHDEMVATRSKLFGKGI